MLITLLAISNLREAGLLTDPSAAKASLLDVALPECDNAMTLQPQQESCSTSDQKRCVSKQEFS
jgi:hypothetical protein